MTPFSHAGRTGKDGSNGSFDVAGLALLLMKPSKRQLDVLAAAQRTDECICRKCLLSCRACISIVDCIVDMLTPASTCTHMRAYPPACVVACDAFSWHVPDDTVTRALALAGRLASLLPSARQLRMRLTIPAEALLAKRSCDGVLACTMMCARYEALPSCTAPAGGLRLLAAAQLFSSPTTEVSCLRFMGLACGSRAWPLYLSAQQVQPSACLMLESSCSCM
jgi:hypothetical protein